jgi:hypothetical protein
MARIRIAAFTLALLTAGSSSVTGQGNPLADPALYVMAVDTVIADLATRGFTCHPPRLLNTVHLQPFRRLDGTISPAVLLIEDIFGLAASFRRHWPGAAVVDSINAVDTSGVTLRPGGCLFVLAPIEWRGPTQRLAHLAAYYARINYGAEVFVLLSETPTGWHPTRIWRGLQN